MTTLCLKTPLLVKWRTFGFVGPMSLHFDIVIKLNVKAESLNVLSFAFYSATYLTFSLKRNVN